MWSGGREHTCVNNGEQDMVVQVVSNCREINDGCDVDALQVLSIANTGNLE